MGTSGIDYSTFKRSVRVQDDLFRHVNGLWLDTVVIPPDRGSEGVTRALFDRAEQDVKVIIEGCDPAAPGDEGRIGSLYASFLDEARIELVGTDPLHGDLLAIEGADTRAEVAAVVGELQRTGVTGPIELMVDTDPGDPGENRAFTCQSGLGLPDESYYRDAKYEEIREQYVTHIASMLALAGLPQVGGDAPSAPAMAERIMAVETQLAAGHWDAVKDRDLSATYNPMELAQLIESAPGFPWRRWLAGMQVPQHACATVIVREPSFAAHLGQVWQEATLADLKLWATWQLIHARAPYLPAGFVAENFAFYGTVLQGTQQLRDRWKRGVAVVEGAIGEAVGRLYVAQHFPPAAKAQVRQLVDNLIAAYHEAIEHLSWMGEQTRASALAKLAKFTPKIGYPDKWRDYGALTFDAADLVGNVRAAEAYEHDYQLAKIGQPVDRDEWFMTPQTVNAYYNPGMNEIVFPAAILQPPFFDPQAEDAANYGGIGAIIGHEIGHGFDDQGSKFDGDGRLVQWWSPKDQAEFEARTQALVAQYDAYVPEGLSPDHHVNGSLTIGENIGDLGGLAIAIKAYLISLDGAEPPVIDGEPGLARLFYSWARAWCSKDRPELAEMLVATDPHSPAEFRCNGAVRNIDEFYEVFGLSEHDALYLPPGQRVSIWA